MKTVEVNDPVECEVIIASDRVTPEGSHARVCRQCGLATWAHTSACMWCGYDRSGLVLRWLVGATCVVFPLLYALNSH